MLPPDQYRKWTYPPPGRQWLQFGDKQLNQAIDSISKEAHEAMTARREGMRQVHEKYLEKNNYFPIAPQQKALHPPSPSAPPPSPVEHFSIADAEEDGYQSAEEGPSRTSRMIEGVKHVTKNYAWPITRDILAPAAGDVAMEVAKGTASAAAWLIGKSFWSLADIVWALNRANGGDPPDEEGAGYPPIGWGGSSSSGSGGGNGGRPAIGNGSSADDDIDELAKKGKGYLTEKIYKQPGWARMFGREDANGYTNDDVTMFRKKLGKMSPRDLAKVLVQLKRGS